MRNLKQFKLRLFSGVAFLIIYTMALALVACNDADFEQKHPNVVAAALEAEKLAEQVIEPLVDAELHLPSGTTELAVTTIEAKISSAKTTPP